MKTYIYMNENLHKKNYKKLPCIRVQQGQKYVDCFKVYTDFAETRVGLLKAAKHNVVRAWHELTPADCVLLFMKPRTSRMYSFDEVVNGTHIKR